MASGLSLRCPMCGDMSFEHVDFHMPFGIDGQVNQLRGERCSNCGHVLLFLNHVPPDRERIEDVVIPQIQRDVYN